MSRKLRRKAARYRAGSSWAAGCSTVATRDTDTASTVVAKRYG
jgi:hypothetical protein